MRSPVSQRNEIPGTFLPRCVFRCVTFSFSVRGPFVRRQMKKQYKNRWNTQACHRQTTRGALVHFRRTTTTTTPSPINCALKPSDYCCTIAAECRETLYHMRHTSKHPSIACHTGLSLAGKTFLASWLSPSLQRNIGDLRGEPLTIACHRQQKPCNTTGKDGCWYVMPLHLGLHI